MIMGDRNIPIFNMLLTNAIAIPLLDVLTELDALNIVAGIIQVIPNPQNIAETTIVMILPLK